MQVSKIIILLIGLLCINSCISQKTVIPSDIDINKNRLIYRNEQREIWAHDRFGAYHHYTPDDSAQYFTVTNFLSSHLESIFAGYCNKHRSIEIISVTPTIVTVITGPNNNVESVFNQKYGRKNEVGSGGTPQSGVWGMGRKTQGETHQTIQSEQRSGGSSGKKN